MGGHQSVSPEIQIVHKKSPQDVVKLMMPVYFCKDVCTFEDMILAKSVWDMIINDSSPYFEKLRGSKGYEYKSCIMLFYASFYARLFDVHPLSRQMFVDGASGQGTFLVGMITICLTEITQKDTAFTNRLVRLAEAHNDKGVKAIEYGIVGEVLFWTLRHCVGPEDFTASAQLAWMKIFSRMLSIMVPVAVSYELKTKSLAQSDRMTESAGSASRSSTTTLQGLNKQDLNIKDLLSSKLNFVKE